MLARRLSLCLAMAVTAGLPLLAFVVIRICQVTLGVSKEVLGWADPAAIVATHRSLWYSRSALVLMP